MKIKEEFVEMILREKFPNNFQAIYEASLLLQYLDGKMKAVHSGSKTRRSLANIYAIYAILHYYVQDFYGQPNKYRSFSGYEYTRLFSFYRSLYGGYKLQNHALNSRVNGEFRNKFPNAVNDLIINNSGRYLLHIDYLYVGSYDISQVCCQIIERYIMLLREKDQVLADILRQIHMMSDYEERKKALQMLLNEEAEARIFEIISYAILRNHYQKIAVYFGFSRYDIHEERLQLYRTGRTNSNDGGIDFVMRPVGRFFQVTEVGNYDKYLLDIDKVMHFPITFVVKTTRTRDDIMQELVYYIRRKSNGMLVIENRYYGAIEEIITLNELWCWVNELNNNDIDNIIIDIDMYYKMEMNIDNIY